MYLYEKQNNNINIYDLEPDNKSIIEFRKQLMSNELEKSMYIASTSSTTPNKILEEKNEVKINDLNMKTTPIVSFSPVSTYVNRFHSFKLCKTKEDVLINYYKGNYQGKKLVKVYKEDIKANNIDDIIMDMNFKGIGVEGFINNKYYIPTYRRKKIMIYYLLITEKYSLTPLSNDLKMQNIISIPKSLYLLESLLNGDLSELEDENIDEFLELFYFYDKPILTVPYDYLKKIIDYGLIEDNKNKIEEKIDKCEKILKKFK